MTATPALRICAAFQDLPAEMCACPDRCRIEQCSVCLREVHYDPAACIPALGPETIICTSCAPIDAFIGQDGAWIEPRPGSFAGAQDPAFRLPHLPDELTDQHGRIWRKVHRPPRGTELAP